MIAEMSQLAEKFVFHAHQCEVIQMILVHCVALGIFYSFELRVPRVPLATLLIRHYRSQWSSGNTLACGARGPRF